MGRYRDGGRSKAMSTVADRLQALGACENAVSWSEQFGDDGRAAWFACTRPQWLLWLAYKLGLRRQCVLACAICVARVLRYVPAGELQPRAVVIAAVLAGRGKAAWNPLTRLSAVSDVYCDAADTAYSATVAAAAYTTAAFCTATDAYVLCADVAYYAARAVVYASEADSNDAYDAERSWQCAAVRRVISFRDVEVAATRRETDDQAT